MLLFHLVIVIIIENKFVFEILQLSLLYKKNINFNYCLIYLDYKLY
jgi:hypothetical protein